MNKTSDKGTAPPTLEEIRGRIDEVDAGLVDLLATRAELARAAAVVKTHSGHAHEDLAREAAVVRRASVLARERGLEPELTRDVFWRVMALSRWHQRTNGSGDGS